MQQNTPADRNKLPIREVLALALPKTGAVLEIASGSGVHVACFAENFPDLVWQPSDPDPAALASIAAWRAEAGLPNLRQPVRLDAVGDWPAMEAAAILCINMVHISPWEATLGLMKGAGGTLSSGGLLYLYGPYTKDGVETAPSNLAFDASLKGRDPRWGLRAVDEVIVAAKAQGLDFEKLIEMPANNISLLFRRV